MKRIIGGVLAALAIASVPVAVPAAAGATPAPQPASLSVSDVQPFLWGYHSHLKTLQDCVAAGEWGILAGRWRAYDCVYVPDDWEWPWDLYVDYI